MKMDTNIGVKKYKKREQDLGSILEVFLKPVFEKQGFAITKILFNWHKIILSKDIINYAKPIKITSQKTYTSLHHVLLVECDNPFVAQKIAYEKQIIIERIKIFLGYAAVTDIKTKLVPKGCVKPKHIRLEDVPLSNRQINQIENLIDGNSNDELFDSLKSLGITIFKRDNLKLLKKGVPQNQW